jgi:hypothetical protein
MKGATMRVISEKLGVMHSSGLAARIKLGLMKTFCRRLTNDYIKTNIGP